jgi:hypothetical protein
MEDHTDTKGINMMRKRQIQELMTQDEIIEMAMLEAEFVSHGKPSEEESELFVCTDKDIVRFYKLLAAKEREAAIKIIKETPCSNWCPDYVIEAIRARGQA